MILYHGTSAAHLESISRSGIRPETWLAAELFHAYRLAVRRGRLDNAEPVVVAIELKDAHLLRVNGRDLPTYQYFEGPHRLVGLFRMSSEALDLTHGVYSDPMEFSPH